MLESLKSNELEYTKLTPEEQKNRGILGRLVGVIADFKNPTRNGRIYKESVWDKLFEDPIMKERVANRCCFGELGHPEDRIETNMEKIAICLAEIPKKDAKGRLQGVFDILDTPNGKILKTLCDYGCNIGVSSRGNGDIVTDYDGTESVDPDTFSCEGWDAVLIPAVKDARPKYVKESYQGKGLNQALTEALNSSSSDDRRIMESTLKELKIDIATTNQKVDTIDADGENLAADNDGAQVIKDLQESLKKNREYEKQLKALQENLSVCYTKENEQDEQIKKLRRMLKTAQEVASKTDALSARVKSLSEQLSNQKQQQESYEEKINSLQERLKEQQERRNRLVENYKSTQGDIENLNQEIKSLKESLVSTKRQSRQRETTLNEQIEELKKDSSIKNSEYRSKLESASRLVEKYQRIAKTAVDKYIASQAIRLGVTASQIKNRLRENYSFEDIDKACEELSRYKVSVNSLPFELRENVSQGKIKVTKSKEPIVPDCGLDDNIDEWLASQATKN